MAALSSDPVARRIEALEAERHAAWKAYVYLDAGAEEAVMKLYGLASGTSNESAADAALKELETKRAGAEEALQRYVAATREALALLDGRSLLIPTS